MSMKSLCLRVAKREARKYGVRVEKWTKSVGGSADPETRGIRCRPPTTLRRLVIFLHEVGHCVNGRVQPEWWDEYLAWEYAMDVLMVERLDSALAEGIRDANLKDAVHRAGRAGWIRFVPDWLAQEARLDPEDMRRRYGKGAHREPPDLWERCPVCAYRELAKRRARRRGKSRRGGR